MSSSSPEFINKEAGFVRDGDVIIYPDVIATDELDETSLSAPADEVRVEDCLPIQESQVLYSGESIAELVEAGVISAEQARDLGMAKVAYQAALEEKGASQARYIREKTRDKHRTRAKRYGMLGKTIVVGLFALDLNDVNDGDRLTRINYWLRNVPESYPEDDTSGGMLF